MTQAIEWITYLDARLYDEDGNVIGTIEEFLVESDDGTPAWAVVVSEADESTRSYVPMRDARVSEDGRGLQVPVDSDTLREAPRAQSGGDLSHEEERRLYNHYGQSYPGDEASGEDGGASGKRGLLRRLLRRDRS
jgi:hypothetical protein